MELVTAELTAVVWKILVEIGEEVTEGQEVAILESMKMEIPVEASATGRVVDINVAEGDGVSEGTVLLTLSS